MKQGSNADVFFPTASLLPITAATRQLVLFHAHRALAHAHRAPPDRCVIVLNVFGMALYYHRMEEETERFATYSAVMAAFSYFYYCECILKIFAMGGHYFQVSVAASGA